MLITWLALKQTSMWNFRKQATFTNFLQTLTYLLLSFYEQNKKKILVLKMLNISG